MRDKRWVVWGALLLLGLLSWGKARGLAGNLPLQDGVFQLQYERKVELTAVNVQQLEEEAGRYAFACQSQGVTVEAPLFQRSRSATLLEVFGDAALMLPAQPLAAGRYPQAYANECAISAESADSLWGSRDVLGNTLWVSDREYTVCGVFYASQSMVVLPWNGRDSFYFTDGAYMSPRDTPFPKQEQERFLSRCDLEKPVRVGVPHSAAVWLRQAAQLPLLAMGVAGTEWLLWRLLPRKTRWARWARRLLRLGMLLVMAVLLEISLPLSPESFPTRWSDFTFWSDRMEELLQRGAARWTLPGLLPDYLLKREFYDPILAWSALGTVCIGLAAGLAAGERKRHIYDNG